MASLTPHSGNLGTRLAKHLLRRTSWKVNKARIDQFADLTADQAADLLLAQAAPKMEQPVDPANGLPWINNGSTPVTLDPQLRYFVLSWWLEEAYKDESIGSKMAFFWHQQFITSLTTGGVASANYYDYLALLRKFALGNVKTLAKKMVTDNTMLRYLNNNENTVTNPQENFAREFFELFTIQKGPQIGAGDYTNYTEDDIVAAARVLTGFRSRTRKDQVTGLPINIDPETGIPQGQPVAGQHDKTSKVFSAHFGGKTITGAQTAAAMWGELDTFVTMIFDQDATAKSYVRRFYRFFVSRFIDAEIEADIIAPLATQLKNDNYEVKNTIKKLLASQHFFDADDSSNSDEIVAGLIKSPVETVLQTMSMFDLPTPDVFTAPQAWPYFWFGSMQNVMFGAAGLQIFIPSDVAGYPAYYQEPDFNRQWFNSSTIICRYKIGEMLLSGTRVLSNGQLGVKLDISKWLKNQSGFTNISDAESLVTQFLTYFFQEMPDQERFDYFLKDAFSDGLPLYDWTDEWNKYVSNGNDSEVKIWLSRLFNSVVYSPEYQLF